MKKIILVLLLSILALSMVEAYDVGYVLKSKRTPKAELIEVFTELNLTYQLIEDSKLSTYNLNNYRVVLFDEGILRNSKKLAVYNYPSVIMNSYYGMEWGLTDNEGISQLAASIPLSVKLINNGVVQVYTQSKDNRGINLPYYFIDDENKIYTVPLARTYTGNISQNLYNFGDVVAIIPEGTPLRNNHISTAKMCFFGIAKTQYWTPEAKQLFFDCIGSILIECTYDEECFDSNPQTDDFCRNPGTVHSYCEHIPVIGCSNNSDCGDGSFMNAPYCVGNDIYDSFENDICLFPATTESYCSTNLTAAYLQTCPYACLDGECIRCNENLDCNDNNGSTMDICNEPGTAASFCTNEDIECSADVDCGISGFNGNTYCGQDGNVYQEYVNYTCMNASTEYSYCNSQTNPVITENCNAKDKLYDTNNTRWINRNECSEKEQTERMYEDYSCLVSQCVPSMQSQWRDTGNRRNKAVGTYCGSARDCHESFCNGFFAEMYPADGHDSCDGSGNCRTYSCNYQSKSCSDDDTFDGINSLTCNAECDQNSDCQETECDSLDRCVGLDYYDYENVTNTCLSSCACSTNACSSPTIYPYDNRCNVCEVDNDCNYLDADYCIGTTLTHDEGKCVNNRCERAEETVEDCGARHIIMNTCGLMVWSCSEELNEVVCVAVDIQPQQDLCQDNTECNSVTFRCV